MLVDDSISRGGSVVASSAPGERGGNISLLDLPMERDGRELLRHSMKPQHYTRQHCHESVFQSIGIVTNRNVCQHWLMRPGCLAVACGVARYFCCRCANDLTSVALHLLQLTRHPLLCFFPSSVAMVAWLNVLKRMQLPLRVAAVAGLASVFTGAIVAMVQQAE